MEEQQRGSSPDSLPRPSGASRISRLVETVLVALVAGSCGAYLTYALLANPAGALRSSPAQNAQLKGIVADYIAKHPDVITGAQDALQAKQAAQQESKDAALIRAHQTEIFADKISPTLGAASGDVVIAEFFDFRCPYCKSTAPILEGLLSRNSHVKIVMKSLPILGPDSEYAARLGYAAARIGRFSEFYTTIFAKVPAEGDRASIDKAVRSMGLNPAALYKQGQTKDTDAALQRDFRLAATLGITGTPALVVGQKLIVGAPENGDLAEAIDAAQHDAGTNSHDSH